MAGQPGQPSGNPSQLKSPIPNEDPGLDAFDPGLDGFEADSLDAVDNSVPMDAGADFPGAGIVEGVANYLPEIGGIAGGIAGGVAGTVFGAGVGAVPGAIGGAALGAAGGAGWKQIILQDVLKRVPQQSATARAADMGTEAAVSGAGSLVGLGVSKGVAKLAATKTGQAAIGAVADKAAAPLAAIKATVERARDEIFDPVAKILATKVTPLTGEEAGIAIKNQFANDIKNRFAGFVKAYGELDEVAKDIPLNDVIKESGKVARSVRTQFTDKVRNEGLDLPQGTYNVVKQYADRFDQSLNGRDFVKVMGDLRGAAEAAAKDAVKYNSNAVRDRAASLMKFADEAEAYYEDKIVGGLAQRVAKGTATMDEINGFQRMMVAQKNPNVSIDPNNLVKYTKSVAKDYLEQKEAVKQGYKQFRGLLEDIGDVAKVRSTRMGPNQFVRALNDVPPDVLAQRAFDPKNAGAMLALKKQYPGVYDTIVKNKMSDIIAKNTGVDEVINYKGIAETINQMPESSARLLLDPKQYSVLAKAVNDPRLALLQSEQTGIANRVALGFARLGEIMRTGAKEVVRTPGPIMPKTSAAVGQSTFQLGQAFTPGISAPPPDEM